MLYKNDELIEASFDAMQDSYAQREEYRTREHRINETITDFRATLNPTQTEEFIHILDMIGDSNGIMNKDAFLEGIHYGIAIRQMATSATAS